MKEYVVTLHQREDLEDFYADMETEGGDLYIPNRQVETTARRPTSRSTNYLLTDDEASILQKDKRVRAVELPSTDTVVPTWSQTSDNWRRSPDLGNIYLDVQPKDRNWAILAATTRPDFWGNWGYSPPIEVGSPIRKSATATATGSGANVDVVISDFSMLLSNSPEYRRVDGSSRLVQYQFWENHAPGVLSGYAPGSLVVDYTEYPSSSNQSPHGQPCGTLACGNHTGLAKDANVYYIGVTVRSAWDALEMVRQFHMSKPANPKTGHKNPTVVSCSWVNASSQVTRSEITEIVYRGTVYTLTTAPQDVLKSMNIPLEWYRNTFYLYTPPRVEQMSQVEDLIESGVVVVAGGGNDDLRVVPISHPDYNNSVLINGSRWYPNRGPIWYYVPGVITVGAIDPWTPLQRPSYSNYGPGISIFAPTEVLAESYLTATPLQGDAARWADERNPNYVRTVFRGTSAATPVVTGAVACLLETWPRATQDDVYKYLVATSTKDAIDVKTPTAFEYMADSYNRFLYYKGTRPQEGSVETGSYKPRPTSGQTFPRRKVTVYQH